MDPKTTVTKYLEAIGEKRFDDLQKLLVSNKAAGALPTFERVRVRDGQVHDAHAIFDRMQWMQK